MPRIACMNISCWSSLRKVSPEVTDNDESTLVQIMAWCHWAPSHYLVQCWPRSKSPYDTKMAVKHAFDTLTLLHQFPFGQCLLRSGQINHKHIWRYSDLTTLGIVCEQRYCLVMTNGSPGWVLQGQIYIGTANISPAVYYFMGSSKRSKDIYS